MDTTGRPSRRLRRPLAIAVLAPMLVGTALAAWSQAAGEWDGDPRIGEPLLSLEATHASTDRPAGGLEVSEPVPRLVRGALLAIEHDTGTLWLISLSDLTIQRVGETNVRFWGALELGPDGSLYGFTIGSAPVLYRIDPRTAVATAIAPLDMGAVFEGALAFGPDGTAYATNLGSVIDAWIFTLDLETGRTERLSRLEGDRRDVNGLAWRRDGELIGLDRIGNALRRIDPWTGAHEKLVDVQSVGGVGGMAVLGNQTYFVTGGPTGSLRGSHTLFRLDPFRGEITEVMTLRSAIPRGTGVSGLSAAAVDF